MRLKKDYMGNDQLLPAYNLQMAVCDEYIAIVDVKPYASDMECFVPLMEVLYETYGHYPKYPVADAEGMVLTIIIFIAKSMGWEIYKIHHVQKRQTIKVS